VKPVAFAHAAPREVPAALQLLSEVDAVALAGGQSLVPQLNLRKVRPRAVVDLNRLTELDHLDIGESAVRIGAMTRMRALERDPGLRRALPVLPQAIGRIADRVVRTRGTIGGSLCHADPAGELPVLAVALGARLHLRSVRGSRVEPAATFFYSAHVTSRARDELLTEVEFPLRQGFRWRFAERSRRAHSGPPLVSACLGVATDGAAITGARLAGGGIRERPMRLPRAEERLRGTRLGTAAADVLDAAERDAEPPAECAYRRALLRALLAEVLSEPFERWA